MAHREPPRAPCVANVPQSRNYNSVSIPERSIQPALIAEDILKRPPSFSASAFLKWTSHEPGNSSRRVTSSRSSPPPSKPRPPPHCPPPPLTPTSLSSSS